MSTTNLLPDYFKNGKEFIKQNVPNNTKNDEYQFYFNDNEFEFHERLKTMSEDWHYRTKKITYDFNSLGYRTKEFNDIDWENSIVMFGCSCTFGLGVAEDETLSYQLSQLLGKDVINMGVVGGSNQFMLDSSLVLSRNNIIPYGIIMMWSTLCRFPYYEYECTRHMGHWDINDVPDWVWFTNKNDNLKNKRYSDLFENLYYDKSHELVTYSNIIESSRLIWSNKSRYYEGSFFYESQMYGNFEDFFYYKKDARDLSHPGYNDYKNAAVRISENKIWKI